MNEESKRMNTLIDDILSLSKVESEEHILPSTTISIFEPINSVISTIKKSGLLKNNNLILIDNRVDKTQSLIVEADFLELTQVFYNLIENDYISCILKLLKDIYQLKKIFFLNLKGCFQSGHFQN